MKAWLIRLYSLSRGSHSDPVALYASSPFLGSDVGSFEPFFFNPQIDRLGVDLQLLRYLLYGKYFCHKVFPLQ